MVLPGGFLIVCREYFLHDREESDRVGWSSRQTNDKGRAKKPPALREEREVTVPFVETRRLSSGQASPLFAGTVTSRSSKYEKNSRTDH